MPSSPASPSSASGMAPNQSNLTQLLYLFVLLGALNETCKEMGEFKYSSGSINGNASLSPLHILFNKLAQICDTEKGGKTVTALVCLAEAHGPEFLFCSNQRKPAELQQTQEFLSGLLTFVATNPRNLNQKPMQKMVLWRILAFNFKKVNLYVDGLVEEITKCIEQCESSDESKDFETACLLYALRNTATFSRDIASSENDKFLKDCEALIKAAHNAKSTALGKSIDAFASEQSSDSSVPWCQLRHYLGRLHSYRQAAEVIVAAPAAWPELFQNFTVNYIPSASIKKIPLPKSSSFEELVQVACPNLRLGQYAPNIAKLQQFGLDDKIERGSGKMWRTKIHGEVNLHDYLVQQGKTLPSHFWGSSAFIATSKPPCRLCHMYFGSSGNDFQIQSPHMNLYPKWRLPNVCSEHGERAVDAYDDLVEDMIGELQQATERLLQHMTPTWKRNDSRTNTFTGISTRSRSMQTDSNDARSYASMPGGPGVRVTHPHCPPSPSNAESWSNLTGHRFNCMP